MQPLTWTALEYEHYERSGDWFWSLGIVALGGAILAIIFGNILFALFIILGSVTLALHALRHPHEVVFEINERGIVIDTTLFPYQTLEAYAIHEHRHIPRLVIKSQKVIMPYLTVALEGVTPEQVRDAVGGNLPEHDLPQSVSERVMELLGF
jgi:hypothetical protein